METGKYFSYVTLYNSPSSLLSIRKEYLEYHVAPLCKGGTGGGMGILLKAGKIELFSKVFR